MELFLLLSIGMSIVAFISVALNQAPPPQPVTDQKTESAFPLESYIFTSEKRNILRLNDEVLLQDFKTKGNQDYALIHGQPSLLQKEVEPALSGI